MTTTTTTTTTTTAAAAAAAATTVTVGTRNNLVGGKRRNENRRTDHAGRTLDKQGAIEINREYYEKYAQTRNSSLLPSCLPQPTTSSFRSLSLAVWPSVCPRRTAHLQPTFLTTRRSPPVIPFRPGRHPPRSLFYPSRRCLIYAPMFR